MKKQERYAVTAAKQTLNAWPGMLRSDGYEYGVQDIIHLPLPQEPEA